MCSDAPSVCFTRPQVAGGNSIFNVIVDNDDTAAKLMTLLEKRKLGRVTFMPLNKLKRPKRPRKEVPQHVCYLIEVRCSTAVVAWCDAEFYYFGGAFLLRFVRGAPPGFLFISFVASDNLGLLKRKLSPLPYEAGECSSSGSR